jgi:hypothetical protein
MQRCSDSGDEIGRDVCRRVDKEGHRIQATVFEEVVDKPRRCEDADRMFQVTATGGSKRPDLGTDTHGKTN